MQPATPSTNSVSHADGRCPMPVDSSQGLALSMAKESLFYLIVLPSVLPPGGRIKDISVPWIFGNDRQDCNLLMLLRLLYDGSDERSSCRHGKGSPEVPAASEAHLSATKSVGRWKLPRTIIRQPSP